MTESPPQTNDVYEVPRDSAKGVLVDSVESSLLSVKIRDADNYNDQTRFILQQCIHLMPLSDRSIINLQLDKLVRYPRIPCTGCVANEWWCMTE